MEEAIKLLFTQMMNNAILISLTLLLEKYRILFFNSPKRKFNDIQIASTVFSYK